MAFTPKSRVYLLDAPLDNKYDHQIKFSSENSQETYFRGRIKHVFDDITYQRKDNSFNVGRGIDSLWNSNYVMYQNENFTNKWFYAFITRMEYVSDYVTKIFIETDVYQSWLFDAEIKESFVIREHVADDTIGANLVDEQLETGDYIMETYAPVNQMGFPSWIVLGVSDNSPTGSTVSNGNVYGNVPSGLSYWIFPTSEAGADNMKLMISKYMIAGQPHAIVIIFTIPNFIVTNIKLMNPLWDENTEPMPSTSIFSEKVFTEDKHITALDGYIPKNNKMFTYPYKFLYTSNSNGLTAEFHYEYFAGETMYFSLLGSIMPNIKIMLAPIDYKGVGTKYEYGLILEGFPIGSWTEDTYTAWLAQNMASTAINLLGSGTALVGGVMSDSPMMTIGGAMGVANQLAQWHKASIQPDQAKGHTGGGNLMYGIGKLDFYFAHMSIRAEYAQRIDNYFTQYGYKVNTLKVPALHTRTNWNYIKTIDVNIVGSIPTDDMVKLKNIYDKGVTLWHTTANFLDYSMLNSSLWE